MKRSKTTQFLACFIFGAIMCLLSSCVKWNDGSPGSVWDGGLWIVFWLPFLGALFCWYKVYRGANSPFMAYDKDKHRWYEIAPKTPVYKVQYFWWAVGLTVATILIYLTVTVWEN